MIAFEYNNKPLSIVVSTPSTVMISHVYSDNEAQALLLAESECKKYGKHAVPIPDSQNDDNAEYECK